MEQEEGGGGGGGGGGISALDGMAQEGRCPNVEVQHLRKREYPDEVEQGVLTCSGMA